MKRGREKEQGGVSGNYRKRITCVCVCLRERERERE